MPSRRVVTTTFVRISWSGAVSRESTPERPLSDVARQALLEAADRRAAEAERHLATEHGGPTGPEPTRYGDWEKKGLAIDF